MPSLIIDSFFKSAFKTYIFLETFLRKSYLINTTRNLSWINISVFLFIIFLPIAPASQVEIAQFSSQNFNTNVLSQSNFGIVLLSPANFLLIALLLIIINQFRKSGERLKVYPHEIVLPLFLVLAEISLINSIDSKSSLIWFLKLIFAILIYFVFSRIKLSNKILKTILYAFIFTIFFETILA